MVGAAARGAKQSRRLLIGQSPVIDVTCDSFQREEKCCSDSECSQGACAVAWGNTRKRRRKKKRVVMQRLLYIKLFQKLIQIRSRHSPSLPLSVSLSKSPTALVCSIMRLKQTLAGVQAVHGVPIKRARITYSTDIFISTRYARMHGEDFTHITNALFCTLKHACRDVETNSPRNCTWLLGVGLVKWKGWRICPVRRMHGYVSVSKLVSCPIEVRIALRVNSLRCCVHTGRATRRSVRDR